VAGQTPVARADSESWPNYGNDPGGMRFPSLTQIDRENVSNLIVAWVYHTGDISDGHDRHQFRWPHSDGR
jgi:glucose dehydrogenase